MAETAAKVPIGRRNSGKIGKYSDEPESMGVMIFGFLEESEESQESSCNSGDSFDGEDFVGDDGEEEEEDENSSNVEEDKAFWETQGQLLEAILRRRSSFESKIKQAVKDAIKELNSEGFGCICRRPVNDCRNCKQREISSRLQIAGFNCSICRSKWKSSSEIPSGEHTYLEVVMDSSSSSSKRSSGGETRVVIELNFRAEFEMARASQEYHHLIHQLPEIFVGKSERLRALIKILCSAAKKCMKDQKMHMAPWRKQKYMQAKWVGKSEQKTLSPFLPVNKHLDRPPKQRASMLTFDLLEINNFATLHCTAVKVV